MSYERQRRTPVGSEVVAVQASGITEEVGVKKNASNGSTGTVGREQLNRLMDAVALIIVRRQMRRYWATGHRATLPSII